MSDIKYDPTGNSNSSFHVEADYFCMTFSYFSMYSKC